MGKGFGCFGDIFDNDNGLIWIILIVLLVCCTDILDCFCDGDNNLIWIILLLFLLCDFDCGCC